MTEQITHAFVLKKIVYKEADYIISFYSSDFGKISCIARSAKKSSKRFGGRLEPFLNLKIKIKPGIRHIKYLEDCSIIKSYADIMNDLDKYKWGSFILEYIENLSEAEEQNRDLYELLQSSIEYICEKNDIINMIPRFQYKALRCVGLTPELTACFSCGRDVTDEGYLSIRQGGIACIECGKKSGAKVEGYKFIKKFDKNDKQTIMKNIALLTRFTKFHTGKEFKSERFVMEN
ncbi:MAG: DNA repair protein RecO [Candidatus Dadabacteria bacterium]|nr:DNA repair protein RecO [Candidatus Dadabacteria bacterium]NIV41875.1 DNA repair protein RecO [Candidatus Dadabacteria bacterium]NIX15773.1 DNA repair protein RecO [Candidatus Dadabacteria bacterium]